MSVINDMLRDLEARKAPEREGPSNVNVVDLIEPQTDSSFINLKSLSLLILILAMAFGVWYFLKPQTQSTELLAESQFQSSGELNEANESVNVGAEPPKVAVERTKGPEQAGTQQETKVSEPVALKSEVAKQDLVTNEKNQVSTQVQDLDSNTTVSPLTATTETETVSDSIHKETMPVVLNAPEKSKKASSEQKPLSNPEQLDSDEKPTPIARSEAKLLSQSKPPSKTISAKELDVQNAKTAAMLFLEGQDSQAYRQLYSFISEEQSDLQSRITLVTYLMRDQRIAEAGDLLLGMPIETNTSARQLKARWLVATGKPQDAIHLLNSYFPELDEYGTYYALLASYYQQYGLPAQAVELYTELVKFDGSIADWWAGLAIALDRSGKAKDARLAYQEASRLPNLNRNLKAFVIQRLEQLSR